MKAMADVHRESLQSLHLTPTVRGQRLASATGFVVSLSGLTFLVTNWHVLAGRDAHTGAPLSPTGATPDAVEIRHNGRGIGQEATTCEPLYDPDDPDDLDRVPRWTGHPAAPRVDVAVLPLSPGRGDVRLIPYALEVPTPPPAIDVTDDVAVVGYPFGLRHADKLAIWTRGTVATEFDVDFDDLPCFLIDARTRQGQSGSPVLLFEPHGPNVRFRDPATVTGPGAYSLLLGIYSWRVNQESDLGYVWRTRAIEDAVDAAIAGRRGPVTAASQAPGSVAP
jgi:hypothetical protein